MDLGRAFNYPFKDPGWIVKLLIGAILSIVTLGIIPLGYQVRVFGRSCAETTAKCQNGMTLAATWCAGSW